MAIKRVIAFSMALLTVVLLLTSCSGRESESDTSDTVVSETRSVQAQTSAADKETADESESSSDEPTQQDSSDGADTAPDTSKPASSGGLGSALKFVQPVINSALDKNSTETDWIPAGSHADIKASDVKTASAKVNGNYTEVTMTFKEQTDGSDGDSKNGGPVARGVGTLGSIDGALADLNAEFKSGKENVKLTYTDAKLTCKIDNNTGKIVSGTWHYLVKINISSAELKFKVLPGAINVTNLKGAVDYKVVI